MKCGYAGDSGFYHTWVEGLQACTGFVGASSGEAPAHDMLRRETVLGEVLNTTNQQRNVSEHQNTTYSTGGASRVNTTQTNVSRILTVSRQHITTYSTSRETIAQITDSKGCIKLTKSPVFFSLLFVLVHLQM